MANVIIRVGQAIEVEVRSATGAALVVGRVVRIPKLAGTTQAYRIVVEGEARPLSPDEATQ